MCDINQQILLNEALDLCFGSYSWDNLEGRRGDVDICDEDPGVELIT